MIVLGADSPALSNGELFCISVLGLILMFIGYYNLHRMRVFEEENGYE